jgi:hypothetical protein
MQEDINFSFKKFSEKYGLKTGIVKKSGASKKKAGTTVDSTDQILSSLQSTI